VLHMLSGEFWNDVGATYPNNRGYVVEFSVFPGDFDIDGDVDGNDFLVWQRGGSPNPLSSVDLAAWKENYSLPGLTASGSAVPELRSGCMALFLTFFALLCQRWRV
jgi:hypothetical protein